MAMIQKLLKKALKAFRGEDAYSVIRKRKKIIQNLESSKGTKQPKPDPNTPTPNHSEPDYMQMVHPGSDAETPTPEEEHIYQNKDRGLPGVAPEERHYENAEMLRQDPTYEAQEQFEGNNPDLDSLPEPEHQYIKRQESSDSKDYGFNLFQKPLDPIDPYAEDPEDLYQNPEGVGVGLNDEGTDLVDHNYEGEYVEPNKPEYVYTDNDAEAPEEVYHDRVGVKQEKAPEEVYHDLPPTSEEDDGYNSGVDEGYIEIHHDEIGDEGFEGDAPLPQITEIAPKSVKAADLAVSGPEKAKTDVSPSSKSKAMIASEPTKSTDAPAPS